MARILGLKSSLDLISHLDTNYGPQVFSLFKFDDVLDLIVSRARQHAGAPNDMLVAVIFHVDEYHLLQHSESFDATTATQCMHQQIKSYRWSRRHKSMVGFPIFTATQPLNFKITVSLSYRIALSPWRYPEAESLSRSKATDHPWIEKALENHLAFRYALMDCGPVPRWVLHFFRLVTGIKEKSLQPGVQVGGAEYPISYFVSEMMKAVGEETLQALTEEQLMLMALGVPVFDPDDKQTEGEPSITSSSFHRYHIKGLNALLTAGLVNRSGSHRISVPLILLRPQRLPPFWTAYHTQFANDGKLFEVLAFNQTLMRLHFATHYLGLTELALGDLFPNAEMHQQTQHTLVTWEKADFEAWTSGRYHAESLVESAKWNPNSDPDFEEHVSVFQAHFHAQASEGVDARIYLRKKNAQRGHLLLLQFKSTGTGAKQIKSLDAETQTFFSRKKTLTASNQTWEIIPVFISNKRQTDQSSSPNYIQHAQTTPGLVLYHSDNINSLAPLVAHRLKDPRLDGVNHMPPASSPSSAASAGTAPQEDDLEGVCVCVCVSTGVDQHKSALNDSACISPQTPPHTQSDGETPTARSSTTPPSHSSFPTMPGHVRPPEQTTEQL
eukprot:TRINITY_DN6145_c0_g2_i6.p1 TRINITY_DN6145_c0_g2~~TRINITY_DN6145_c0_g2_i6.p1  ORF type:complete len:611 (-),score=99.88 TRINITY_DN6145_c0_g2_i6:82-1914(-)